MSELTHKKLFNSKTAPVSNLSPNKRVSSVSGASAHRRDRLSPEKRSEVMSKIRGKNTGIELALRKALWHDGIRGYRIHARLPGKPDVAFTRYRVAIFCDGDFWHGYRFGKWKGRLTPYWREKITRNMERDRRSDLALVKEGWFSIHFWEHDVLENVAECETKVVALLTERGFEP